MKSDRPEINSSDGCTPDEQISNALTLVLHILDSFNHRNKNQHRVAHWWSQFDILRRHVRRLHNVLGARLRNTQAQNFKKQNQNQNQKSSKARRALDEDIAVRVEILVESTIPSSFLTFTQLTADNQHAALGLVLVGVLASINSTIAPLAPHRPDHSNNAIPIVPSIKHPSTMSFERPRENACSMDLGVAISRDQLLVAEKAESRLVSHDQDTAKPKKRKTTALVEDPSPAKPPRGAKSEKKHRKKTKKGDEFSDLFSSIM